LSKLGLSAANLAAVQDMLRQSEGIILVTGPTNAGKSTTVYSMLEAIGKGDRHIVSIEDPVEFPVSFVRQMSVDEPHGVTMTLGLRTLLRMDPDVIFVGEVRDKEAAETAMRAASSGRYVLTTLHTRDVASTITALRDLQVDNRSLAGNLTGIINQRLIRRLCLHCAQPAPVDESPRRAFEEHGLQPPAEMKAAKGCDLCRGSGYHGRTGVFETVVMTDASRALIASGATEAELRDTVRAAGTPSLASDALSKVVDGTTSYHEAITMRWL
jgi:type II secretory ATPase GspE/PulE/Tfp pilus assembly ATPase PilB-like protein